MTDDVPLRPLSQVLVQHADRIGHKNAFSDANRELTYHALADRTGRIGCHFAALGLQRGQRIVFYLGDGVEYAEMVLAGVRAALVGVPVRSESTDEELAALLDDCAGTAIVADGPRLAQVSRIARARAGLLVVEAGEVLTELIAQVPVAAPRDDLGLDEPAWILYTSGTTGEPRGVVSTQRAALWSPRSCYAGVLGLSSDDRLLWPLPMFHSFSHSLAILGIVVVGASARIVSEPGLPETIVRLLGEYSATVLAGVPTTYQQLVANGSTAQTSLRLCLTAGAPSTPELRADVEGLLGAPLLDGYGSTETCGIIAIERPGDARVTGACGPPLPGTRVVVRDPDTGQELPPDTDGEIWVRTPGLMLGYHGRPEATAAALVDGWYRSGDRGRLGAHGQLVVTGRVDDLIICGGEKVQPAEIERTLCGLPGVREAVVVGRAHPLLGQVPVAYVVPRDDGVDPGSIRRACAGLLSTVKIPHEVILAAEIPRTPSGKPLRRRLAEQSSAVQPLASAAGVRDLVRAETAVACGLPDSDDVVMDTPFSTLGLTSLGAVALAERLSVSTGLPLTAALVFDHPTPSAVADHLCAVLSRSPEPARPPAASPPPRSVDEPIAIVAMGCRYPGGVRSADDLWRLVREGTDATSDLPSDRGWDTNLYDPDPDRVGKSYTRRGGFLHDAAEFDAGLFGMSPREALATDPQQRLLLEVAWETLERAGIAPDTLRGSQTGVFVGVMHGDYASRFTSHPLESHLGIGSAGSVASGRISYTLGLRGPAVTVDTACSSSLVAVHWAARALRAGECDLALAGGVTVMATPRAFTMFSRQRGLSPDGRCRSFSAGANGTGWAEGVGLLLLERVCDARRSGHPIVALIRGSAVNSDGASNGLTAPSGEAQRELIRQALADADLSVADVDAVEGHGTATILGDPIEIEALLATYGQGRDPDRPLWLGSVKSNIGHTQAAAGVASIIKMVQAMRYEQLPRSLYAEQPSPYVDWSTGAVALLSRTRAWPSGDRPRRVGVSSFGIGGTNAHVIVQEPDPAADEPAPAPGWTGVPWLLSAPGEAALRAQARSLADFLEARPEPTVLDIGFSLAVARAAHECRAALVADDRRGLHAALRALGTGRPDPGVLLGTGGDDNRLVVLLPGQGAQRAGMGTRLAARFPAFRAAFHEVRQQLDQHLPVALREAIDNAAEPGLLDRTDFAQAALFAYEVALYRLFESVGVRADHLAGHSVGEVAAAHLAGVLSLADAVRLVAARGRLMAALPGGGAMFSVRASVAEVEPLLAGRAGQVCVAAVNGPADVVISGDLAAATQVAADLAAAGRRTTRLRVSHAFHSPLMEPMLDDFRAVVERLAFHRPTVPIVSTVTGAAATDEIRTPAYWVRQARDTVLFGAALTRLAEAGATTFLEVGPGAALTALCAANLPAELTAGCVAAVPDVSTEETAVLAALARLHVRGTPVDWSTVYATSGARRCELPTYAFQRRRYWLDPPPGTMESGAAHPLLGPPVPSADSPQVRYTGQLSVSSLPWLSGHRIGGAVVVPATAFVEMALAAGRQQGACRLDELTILAPLTLPEGATPQVQVVVGGGDAAGRHPVDIFARPSSEASAWTRHATGLIAGNGRTPDPDVAGWPPPGAKPVALDGAYERLAALHYRYDGMFRAVTAAWRHGDDLYAEVSLPRGAAAPFGLHPALLDAALHAGLLAAAVQDGATAEVRVPFAVADVELYATGADAARVHLSPTDTATAVTLTDRSGRPVASIGSLTTRPLDLRDSLPAYRIRWVPVPLPAPATGSAPAGHTVLTVPPAVEETDPMVRTRDLIAELLPALQRSLDAAGRHAGLVVMTRDATGDDPDLAAAALWGMVRSAQAENPGQIMLVDLDGSDASQTAVDRVLALEEPQIAIRDGVAYVPRLTVLEETAGELSPVDLAGTVLVTGGTGALGSLLAHHLVTAHRVRRLVLAGRRGAQATGADALAAALAGSGTEVQIVACDLSDPPAVEELVSACGPDLTAVFHLAGVLDDGVLGTLTPQRMDVVLAPKAGAAWALHTATRHLDLSAFVLYSSASGLFGRPGQANYAAANSFLDALARHRVARGLPARSLVWGLWDTASTGRGMGSTVAARHRRDAILPITPRQGTALLQRALRNAEPVPVLVAFDLAALRDDPGTTPLLQGIAPPRPPAPVADNGGAETGMQAPGAWQLLLADLPTAERQRVLTGLLTTELAAVLGYPDAASFPAGRRFTDLGFDSLSAIQLRNRISFLAGVRLPATVVLDQPTLPQLTAYVHAALPERRTDRPNPTDTATVGYDFASLYHRIINTRGAAEAMAMRFLASYALPSFTAAERDEHATAPVRLTTGGHGPLLAYLPSYVNLMVGSPRRLVEAFDGHASMVTLEYPGMRGDPAVPDSAETLALMYAETIQRVAGDEPVVLAGYCTGGNVAHAVAGIIERTGTRPAGLVLLDSHQPTDSRRDDRQNALMAWGAELPGEQFRRLFDDSVIVAGGAYSRLFDGWRPEPVTVPTLLVRAERPTAQMRAADLADWRPRWPLPHDTIDVPGDHWTLLDQDAATTATAIRAWLSSLPRMRGAAQ